VVQELKNIEKHTHSTCDKCGKEIKKETYNAYNEDWFEIKEGHIYPEGGCFSGYKMELCEDCSHELVEILKFNGFNIQEVVIEY